MESALRCVRRLTKTNFRFPLIILLPTLSGCCVWGTRDISSDPRNSYNFIPLLKGRCFQTSGLSVLSLGSYLDAVGPGTGLNVDPNHMDTGELLLPAGTAFRIIRMLDVCGDTGGTHVEAMILNGRVAGRTLDVESFFLPKFAGGPDQSPDGFIIGPHVVPCESEP
ncbi:MAG TPA: hypothetical protein VFC78_08440 [Tepidisphaeraceae bacterium]|nr:hypothetical protein [Tepidisphaeraceae bacterium]